LRRLHGTLLLIAILGTWVRVSVAIPLECHLEQQTLESTGATGEQGQVFSSPIITCQFRVLEEVPGATSIPHQYSLDQICLEDSNNENGFTRRTMCLRGTLQLTISNSPLETGEERHSSLPSTGSSDDKPMVEEEGVTSSTSTIPQKRTIVVGRATYHAPYSEQTSLVAAVLDQAPSDDEPQQEWIDWYIQLAAAHHPTVGQDPANHEVWVQIELTINAYQEAIRALERLEKQESTTMSFNNQVLLASCYFHLGGSYSLDPENRYAEQTVNALESSYTKFHSILQRSTTLETLERTAIESKFAEACSKLGIALVSLLDPIETMPAWAKTMMMLYPADKTHFTRSQQPPKSTTSLDAIQSYFEEAIQIFDRHFRRQDGDNDNSVGAIWNQLVTSQELKMQYAVTLQQSATISSIQGRFSQAKQRFEESLKIHYSLVLAGDAGGAYLHDSGYSLTSIADLHLSLSDTCLQLGDYSCAKETYAEAMTTHLTHNVRVAPIMPMELDAEVDAHIQDTKATLLEYRTSVSGGGVGGTGRFRQPEGFDASSYNGKSNAYFYGKDDGLEGDLLATLGTLYLGTGDPRAISYLEQARDLFAGSKEDRESPVMADLMFNLALAYYRGYEFEKSKELQWQALDLYQNLFGDGVNPYMQGLQEIEDLATWDGHHPAKMIDLDSYQDQINTQNLTREEIMEEL
jgi:tetratricopeptide (TPR) repeat protein